MNLTHLLKLGSSLRQRPLFNLVLFVLVVSPFGIYGIVSADENTTNPASEPRAASSQLSFSEISEESQLVFQGCAYSGAWADYDNDGDLDLYVGNLDKPPAKGYSPGGSMRRKELAEFPHAGNLLYRNNGDDTFTDVVFEAGVDDHSDSDGGVGWSDFDNDGDMDLFVANRGQPDRLYRNNGDGTFTDVAPDLGVDYPQNEFPGNSEGVAWGDYDNDGDPDLFIASLSGINPLYQNNGDGTFTEVTRISGIILGRRSIAASWADFDNDGNLDLYVTTTQSPNLLYLNNGDGTFSNEGDPSGTARVDAGMGDGRGAAIADYDGDGNLDIFVANFGATRNWLFRSNGTDNNFLVVKPEGTISNRNAVGARVTAVATINGKQVTQVREIVTASSRHAQDSLAAEFGLGDASSVNITVEFPSGIVVELKQVEPNQTLEVLEASPDLPNTGGVVITWQIFVMSGIFFLATGALLITYWSRTNGRKLRS